MIRKAGNPWANPPFSIGVLIRTIPEWRFGFQPAYSAISAVTVVEGRR
jgi:hypothetical protein